MSLVYSNYYLTANARRSGSALNLRFGFSPSATSTDTLYHLRSASASLFNFCVNLDECPWAAKNGLQAWVSFTVDGTTVFDKTWFVPTGGVMTSSTVNYSATGTTTLADLWEAFGSQASTAKTCRIILQLHCTNGITHGGTNNAGYATSSTLKSYKDITFTARMYAASGAYTTYVLYSPLTIKSETEVRGLEEFVPASVISLFDSLKTHVTSEHRFTESSHSQTILGVRDSIEDSLVQLTAEVQGTSDEVEEINEKIGDPGYYGGAFQRIDSSTKKRTLFDVLGRCRDGFARHVVCVGPDGFAIPEKSSSGAAGWYNAAVNGLDSDKWDFDSGVKLLSEEPEFDEELGDYTGNVFREYEFYERESTIGDALGAALYVNTTLHNPMPGANGGAPVSFPLGLNQSVGRPLVFYRDDSSVFVKTVFDWLGRAQWAPDDGGILIPVGGGAEEKNLLSLLQQAISEVGAVSNDSKTIVDNTQQVVTNIEQIADDNKKMVSALNLLFERIRVLLSQRNKKIL